ncbi:cytochrome P450 [Aeromicrobium fastidiosum]|uniref:Cytochrome P450 n=1 Tax=Aeromicrobium fastidiosum TaxID=52699 RepID=A0A641ATL9_9ACTN|nr:cytochrome P450 [Aeromicrobium fastidiosum]KAA1380583.1 cytochrome P450 [Aeromicrobium fastidiosum]MBP2390181.1 cytochrome P450 [Aeromicrobium fastidiosum]
MTIDTTITAGDPLPFLTDEYRTDPYPFYAALRAGQPVFQHPAGFWAITGYAELSELLYNRTLGVADLDYGPATPLHDSMLGADAPKHTRVRRTHSRWFTPKAVQQWSEFARGEIATRLDAIVASGGTFDAVHDLAFPVTFATISKLLGVPAEDGEEVRQATHDIGRSLGLDPTAEEAAGTEKAFAWFIAYNERLVAAKRADPGDGLLDSFLAFEDDGTMSHDEVIASLTLLFAVGHLDITYLIVHGIKLMIEQPAIFATYRDEPDRRADIVNEILRIDTPEQFVARMTTQPITVGGVDIPAGEPLILFIGAGNHDPAVFADPETFDIDRDADLSKHLAFGAGPHGCAGQVLARAEAHDVFSALVERFDRIELAGPVTYGHSEFIRSISSLPVSVS